jgi:hypothetical protein
MMGLFFWPLAAIALLLCGLTINFSGSFQSNSNWEQSGSGSGQKACDVDNNHFGHANPDLFEEGDDRGHFVQENRAHILYAWVVLDQKELLVAFIQVLSALVSIDSSSNQPLHLGCANVQCKHKNDDDEEEEDSPNVLRGIQKDLKSSSKSIDARAEVDCARADASIFTGCGLQPGFGIIQQEQVQDC